MNNIYKVIWSKAKNCYVVASEIARSHTKSASGSEKIGGVTRRKLLASLMALSLLCGGLGVAEASVHVNEVPDGTKEVYTIGETYSRTEANARYAKANDVTENTTNIATNKANITALQTMATEQGKLITTNTANIANNTTAIEKKINAETANERFATKVDLTALQNQVTGKADKTYVDTEVGKKANKATTLTGYGITDAYTKAATDTAITTKVNEEKDARELKDAELSGRIDTLSTTVDSKVSETDLNTTLGNYYTQAQTNAAIKTAVDDEKNARDTAIKGEVTERNKAIGDAIASEVTNRDAAITKAKTELKEKVTAEETARKEEDAKLEGKIKENTTAINNEKAEREAADIALSDRIGTVDADGEYIKKSGTNNVSENLEALDTQAKKNADAIAAEATERTNKDTALEGKITKNSEDITKLQGDVTAAQGDIAGLKAKDTELEGKIKNNADNIAATNKRTAGIDRIDATKKTTIEGNVTVDSLGNVTAQGKLQGEGVDAGAVNAGSLNVENASHLKGDVTMDNKLTVTGDTTLKGTKVDGKLTVTDDAYLKNTEVGGTLTTTGNATFKEAVEMDKGLTVTSGDTTLQKTDVKGALNVTGESNLKNTTVDGTLSVNKETTLGGTLTANGEAKFTKKVTMENDLEVKGELKTDKIAMEHKKTDADGTRYNSTTTITADSITHFGEVEKSGVITKSQFTHTEEGSETYAKKGTTADWTETRSDVKADGVTTKVEDSKKNRTNTSQTADGIKGYATDKDGNKTYTKVTATENSFQVQDKDGKNTNHQVNTKDSSVTEITDKNGATTTKTEQTAKDITNTAEQGTITNKAQTIVNNATGDMTNTVGGQLNTTVTGQATQNFNGGLNTTVTGAENHTVTGIQTNTVGGGQINNITGGQENNILTGDQKTTVSDGNIINKAEHGDISNTAKNVTNEGTESVTNKVGTNEVKVSQDGVDIKVDADKTIKESVGADTSRTMTDGRIIDKAGDMTVTTDKTTGTTFGNGTPDDTTVINGGTIGTNKVNANETNTKKLTAGAAADADGGRLTVDANEGVKGSYTSGDYTSRSYILPNTLMSGVDNGKKPTEDGFVGSRTDHYMDGDKAKLDETVKDAAGSNVTNKTSTSTVTTITDGDKTNTVTSTADGTTFSNSEAAAPVTGASGAGTAVNTKIKGNTITTGKVTMDYADVMKDLGVRGNATVDKDMTVKGNTTLGEAGKNTTLTVNSKATFNEQATFENGAEVKNGLTVSSGGLNVTGESTFNDKVTMNNGLDVTGGVASDSFTVKGTDIKIDSSGINAGGTVISNVADGSISEGSKDAVNGGQLYQVKNDLEGKVNKVGANAAAMANLHPMEFDPDSKWNIAAAMGNYGSETATAIGAFYRPNEDVMVNFSTAFGTGENMVGGGVSVRLGKGSNKLSRQESNALKAQVNDLTARMDALLSVLNPNMSKDFPDVPENHWAYEAVSRLAGNDIVQGYPDGEFHGDRTMTRYEMAEIIYNALSRGAEAERELVEEFKPELQAMAASEKATAERAEG